MSKSQTHLKYSTWGTSPIFPWEQWSWIWSANPYPNYLAFGDKPPYCHPNIATSCENVETWSWVCWTCLSPLRIKWPVTTGVLKSARAEVFQIATLKSLVLNILLDQTSFHTNFTPNSTFREHLSPLHMATTCTEREQRISALCFSFEF